MCLLYLGPRGWRRIVLSSCVLLVTVSGFRHHAACFLVSYNPKVTHFLLHSHPAILAPGRPLSIQLFEAVTWLTLTCRLNSLSWHYNVAVYVFNVILKETQCSFRSEANWKNPCLSSSDHLTHLCSSLVDPSMVQSSKCVNFIQHSLQVSPCLDVSYDSNWSVWDWVFNHLSSSLKGWKLLSLTNLLSIISLVPCSGRIPAASIFIEDLILSEEDSGWDLEVGGLLAAVLSLHLWGRRV